MISTILWYVSIHSHQIISTAAPLLCLSSSTTQLHFRMWGRKMAVCGKTTPLPPPPLRTPIPLWDFNFMPWERGTQEFRVHVRKVREYFLAASATIMQGTRTPRSHYWALLMFSRPGKVFHLSTALLSVREDSACFTVTRTNLPWRHQKYGPPPPNPLHPKIYTISQENWVNKQWNQDEPIISRNLLSVIF